MELYSFEIDSALSFDFSIRYRFELLDGMNIKNYGDKGQNAIGNLNDKILLQRVIAGVTYRFTEDINFAFHLYDARAFGWSLRNSINRNYFKSVNPKDSSEYYIMNPNEQFFEIYDMYLNIKNIIPNLSMTLGRQKLYFGDYRVMGPGDWRNTGRWTWDALRFTYNTETININFWMGGTKIQDPERTSIPFTETEYWGGGMYSRIKILESLALEPFVIFKKNGSAHYIRDIDLRRYWIGARLVDSNLYGFDYDFNFTKEFGKEKGKNIDAYGLFARVGYSFKFLPFKPLLSIRYTYATGGRQQDEEINQFDPAYGAQDKYYGWMNIVTWSNLDDREVVLELFPTRQFWIEIKYNDFYVPVPEGNTLLGTLKLKEGSKHLGSEFNIFSRYNLNKNWQFTFVVGYFFVGEVLPIDNQPAKDAYYIGTQVLFNI